MTQSNITHLWPLCWLRLIVDIIVIVGMTFSKPGGAAIGSTFLNPGCNLIGICCASDVGDNVGEGVGFSV